MTLISVSPQMLMVVSTVLERNPEINYSSVLKLDEVYTHIMYTHTTSVVLYIHM